MLVLDFVWLVGIAKNFNISQLGPLMRQTPATIWNAGSGFAVYLLMALAIVVFVLPKVSNGSLGTAFLYGALMGLIIYGVYDGTNYFFINNYPWLMSITDVLWGTVCLGVSFTVAMIVLEKLS
jgi:uncharacterized membrane protein